MKIIVETTEESLTSHAGLVHVVRYLKNKDFRKAINSVSHVKKTSGVYFYRLNAYGESLTKRMVVMMR